MVVAILPSEGVEIHRRGFVPFEVKIDDSSGQGVEESFVRDFKTHCAKFGRAMKHVVHCNVCLTLGAVSCQTNMCLHMGQGVMRGAHHAALFGGAGMHGLQGFRVADDGQLPQGFHTVVVTGVARKTGIVLVQV
jgi:hypothetical protein